MNTDMRSEFVHMRYEWLSDVVWYRNIEAIFSHLILHKKCNLSLRFFVYFFLRFLVFLSPKELLHFIFRCCFEFCQNGPA